MPRQLDILALEPFYGGARKQMLETLVRFSRHRWNVMKLPPRRIERRITAAATWFAEQLSRNWVGRLDVLFASEALNLSAFFRLVPALAKFPSVVYFHSNQLPEPSSHARHNEDLANLSTAVAATDVWFNSRYHLRSFLARAAALVERHPELSSRNPMHGITKKVQFLPPPIDTGLVTDVRVEMTAEPPERNPRLIFVETRDADVRLLNNALGMVDGRGQTFELVTVGPAEGISEDFPRQAVSETDDIAQIQAMFTAGVVASAKPTAASDFLVARALLAGCRPVLPRGACYPEMVVPELHGACLFDPTPDAMATKLINALSAPEPWTQDRLIRKGLAGFDPIAACKAMDDRLEQLAVAAASTAAPPKG
jgi:hypothetical protein